jgi:hypothetical protein
LRSRLYCTGGKRAEGEGVNLLGWLSEMQYPHWLMVAGAGLVVLGFVGFAFRQNKNGAPDGLKAKK